MHGTERVIDILRWYLKVLNSGLLAGLLQTSQDGELYDHI